MSDQLTFLSAEPPANRSASPESVWDWTIRAATSQSSSWRWLNEFAPAGWSGRMSPASIQAGPVNRTMAGIVEVDPSGKKFIGAKRQTSPNSSISFGNAGIVEPGGLLTLNMSEWTGSAGLCPNVGDVASLSDILETTPVPSRYYSTPKACAGLLSRADRRGKALPAHLEAILKGIAAMEGKPHREAV
jgi:hypothetical protein